MSTAVPDDGVVIDLKGSQDNPQKLESLGTDSSGTVFSGQSHKIYLKPQYKLDINASVNAEESPVTKDLTNKFRTLSLSNKSVPPPVLQLPNDEQNNMNWMPTILRNQPVEDITDFGDDVKEKKFDSLPEGNDSVVIHDSSTELLDTNEKLPDWKRAAMEANERKSKVQPKLKEFFVPLDTSGSEKLNVPIIQDKEQQFSTMDSSNFNTAFKLFGQHDSFTSDKLNQIINDIQNKKLSTNETSNIQEENTSIDNVTANKTEDYIKNANALFNNLKLKGAPVKPMEGDWESDNVTSTTVLSNSSVEESWGFKNEGDSEISHPLNATNVDSTIDSFDEEDEEEPEDRSEADKKHEHVQQLYNSTFPHLQPENRIISPKLKNRIYTKPTLIKPEDFQMRFDSNRNEWIPPDPQSFSEEPENDENVMALNAINDLTTISKTNNIRRAASILKDSAVLKPKDLNIKSEVSFKLPSDRESSTSSREDTFNNKSKTRTSASISQLDLTELSQIQDISFSESKRKLISVLTAVEPDGNWNDLVELELVDQDISNLNDMDKIVPNLRTVDLSNNKIRFPEGLPIGIKNVVLSNNLLDGLSIFDQFQNLRYLDISGNSLQRLNILSALENLTTLKASNNGILSIEGISTLDTLEVLNLNGNALAGEIDFSKFDLPNLQKLDVNDNKLVAIKHLEYLPSLISFKADENDLQEFECSIPHLRLKKLSLKMNNLEIIDGEMFPMLRVLRIDGNDIKSRIGLHRLKSLDELSAKGQRHLEIVKEIGQLNNLRYLDLSGTKGIDFSEFKVFTNLNTLNLCAVDLDALPVEFHSIFPNLQELNLNFNKLSNIIELESLKSLRNLFLVSNCLKDIDHIVQSVSNSRSSLRKLDLRLNPMNKGFYSYVFSPQETESSWGSANSTGQPLPDTSAIQLDTIDDIQSFSIHYNYLLNRVKNAESEWALRDKAHLDNLKMIHSKQDELQSLYSRRLDYEAIFLRLCKRITMFDGRTIQKDNRVDAKIRINALFGK